MAEFHNFATGRSTVVIPDHRNSVAATIDMDTHSIYRLARYTPEGLLTVLEDDGTVICAEGADLTVNCKGPDMPFAFNGMWRSEVSGLSYMRNRWYSPHLAQFMSHDPLEYIDSYNLYAFASLDPVNFWDPWGLQAKELVDDPPCDEDCQVLHRYMREVDSEARAAGRAFQQHAKQAAAWLDRTAREAGNKVQEQVNQAGKTVRNTLRKVNGVITLGERIAQIMNEGMMTDDWGRYSSSSQTNEESNDKPEEIGNNKAQHDDITTRGSRYPNIQTNVTKSEFERNLTEEGFELTIRGGGKVNEYKKGNIVYTTRDYSKSTGGPTAEVLLDGRTVKKIRLEEE